MSAPSSSGAAGGLVLTGVTMELAGTRGPATVVVDVMLAVGAEGLTVTPPTGSPVALGWPSVGWARCGEGGLLADGAAAVAIVATVAGRLVRWLVPEDQMPPARAAAIDHLLTARAGGPPGSDAAPLETSPFDRRRSAATTVRPGRRPGLSPVGEVRGRIRGRRNRPVAVVVAWLAILALVLVGAGLFVAASIPARHRPRHGTGSDGSQLLSEARALAHAVSLRLADLPAGWAAVSTPSGPLSGFVDADAMEASSPVGSVQTAARYARCLGVRTAAVPLVSVGPAPLAQSTSGAFAGPATGAPMQVASITDVYATSAPVRRAVAQLERHGFASCFGAAVGEEFARSAAAQAPSGVTTGTATTQSLPLPRWAGIRATGVDLKLPLDVRGEATSVQLGFVFVTGARVEAILVSFSTSGVPESVSQGLAATLEEEVAAAGAPDR